MNLFTSIPDWAVSDEAKAWMLGLGAAAVVRIFRAALRWFKRMGSEGKNYGD